MLQGDFPISEHFTFYEMTKSSDHPELVEQNRSVAVMDNEIFSNLEDLCENHLEWIRRVICHDRPMIVLSGFRCPELNAAVGGSENSQHMMAQAADFYVDLMDVFEIYYLMEEENSTSERPIFHQIVCYPKDGFIHFGAPTGFNDGQCWIQGDKK